MIVYLVVRLGHVLGRALPSRVVDRLAVAIGVLVYWSLPAKRRNMKHNYRIVLGALPPGSSSAAERRVARLARRSMTAYTRTVFDFFRVPLLVPKVIRDTAETEGWEHLDRMLASGRGAIFASIHFGAYDLAGAALANHCPPGKIYGVTEPFKNKYIDAMVVEERAAYGLQSVEMTDVRRMVRILREGNILGVLIDRPLEEEAGTPIRFFGQETYIPAGAASLALLARVPIIPGYLLNGPGGRLRGCILPPIEPQRTGNREVDTRVLLQQVVDEMEKTIRRAPHQWYMFRAMWPLPVAPRPSRPFALRRTIAAATALLRKD